MTLGLTATVRKRKHDDRVDLRKAKVSPEQRVFHEPRAGGGTVYGAEGQHTDCSQLARAPLPVWTVPKSRKSTPETFRLRNSQATGRASPRLPQTINKCSHTVEPPSERMHSCRQRMAPKATTRAHGSLGAGTQQALHSVRPQCPTGLDSTPISATTLKVCDAELRRRGPLKSSCVQAPRQTPRFWEKPPLCSQSIHALFWNNGSLALGRKGWPPLRAPA